MIRSFLILCCVFVSSPTHGADSPSATTTRISFLVCGDPQYLAEHADKPMKLDPLSDQANSGFVKRVLALPGSKLPETMGGGTVATDLRGLINTGDLIDSLDKNGGQPVILSHHLHLDAPEYDWPAEDLAAYYDAIRDYNVIAIFNGHTHGSPPKHRRWDGKRIGSDVDGIDNFDPDDAGASKLHKGKPVGLAHGLLYVEIIDRPGSKHDAMTVRSYVTRDNWETARWDRLWQKQIESPDRELVDVGTRR